MATVRIDAFRSLEELAPLRTQMAALNMESRRPCPFPTFEYIETFLAYDEHDTREEELLFLAAFEDQRLIASLEGDGVLRERLGRRELEQWLPFPLRRGSRVRVQ